MSEKMSPGFALFNCHVNSAKDRAIQELRDMGCGNMADDILKSEHDAGGIMGVRDCPHFGIFVGLVCAFVNENREAVSASSK